VDSGIIVLGFGAAGLLAWGAHLYEQRSIARARGRVPLHTVASAPHGQAVRILGVVAPFPHLGPLIAPFSQTPCLGYAIEVKYGVPFQRKIVTETRRLVLPFLLHDETGTALLEIGASLPFFQQGRATLDKGYFSLGVSAKDYPAVRMFKREKIDQVTERVLLPNDRVMLYGFAMRNSVPSAGDYRTGSREQLSIVAPPPGNFWLIEGQPQPPAPAPRG